MIATLTGDKSKTAPQFYISGTVHGNERLGPSAVTYLVDYMLTAYGEDE